MVTYYLYCLVFISQLQICRVLQEYENCKLISKQSENHAQCGEVIHNPSIRGDACNAIM